MSKHLQSHIDDCLLGSVGRSTWLYKLTSLRLITQKECLDNETTPKTTRVNFYRHSNKLSEHLGIPSKQSARQFTHPDKIIKYPSKRFRQTNGLQCETERLDTHTYSVGRKTDSSNKGDPFKMSHPTKFDE